MSKAKKHKSSKPRKNSNYKHDEFVMPSTISRRGFVNGKTATFDVFVPDESSCGKIADPAYAEFLNNEQAWEIAIYIAMNFFVMKVEGEAVTNFILDKSWIKDSFMNEEGEWDIQFFRASLQDTMGILELYPTLRKAMEFLVNSPRIRCYDDLPDVVDVYTTDKYGMTATGVYHS